MAGKRASKSFTHLNFFENPAEIRGKKLQKKAEPKLR
jgi:hypothetical protein